MGDSLIVNALEDFYDQIIDYLTLYNIVWTAMAVLLWYMSKRSKGGYKNLKLSLPNESHMIYGHAKFMDSNFLQKFGRICVDGADQFGLSSFWLFHQLTVCVLDADHVQAVLLASTYRHPIPIVGRHFDMILGKSSLPQLMRQEWKLHRRLIAKAFSFQHLQHMVKDMNCMGDKFAAALLNGTNEITSRTGDEGSQCVVDVSMACKAVTLDIIGSTVFGFDFDTISTSLDHNPIAMAFDFLLSELTRRQFGNPLNLKNYFYSYPCESNRKFKEAKEVINSTLTKLIADKQLELAKDPKNSSVSEHPHHDILRYLIESYAEENETVDTDFLLENLVTLLFAGYDTTSITLSYLMYCMAQHPEAEERALAEINATVLPGEQPTYDQLTKELVYCTAVVEEVLRLYPPAPLTVRHLEKDLTLRRTTEKTWGHPDKEPVTLPAGTAVYLPIWWIQRSELNFNDPLKFNPERFMPENKKYVKRGASVAFGSGSRDCVGRRFAMVELLSLFVNVFRKVKFSCVENYILEPHKVGVVQKPKGGLPLVVSMR